MMIYVKTSEGKEYTASESKLFKGVIWLWWHGYDEDGNYYSHGTTLNYEDKKTED